LCQDSLVQTQNVIICSVVSGQSGADTKCNNL
jgi:hypothetical protein